MKSLLIISILLICSTSSANDFVQKYCMDCHDSETEKGDVNLEGYEKSLEGIFSVYDQVVLESMPPKKKKKLPTKLERESFLKYLDAKMEAKGHDRKAGPNGGNYLDHEKLFTPNDLPAYSEGRLWRIDPLAFARLANKLIKNPKFIYRPYRQSVGIEHPSFSYVTPRHEFKDFASLHKFDATTTELLMTYADDIGKRIIEANRNKKTGKLSVTDAELVNTVYKEIYNRDLTEEERKDFAGMDLLTTLKAVILRASTVFRVESEMTDKELARTLGYSLSESGPDEKLFIEISKRPLKEIVAERLNTPEGEDRIVRFLREYFEYDYAVNVFKELSKEETLEYKPDFFIEDANEFCKDIIKKDKDVLKQLLTSNDYSIKGTFNKFHQRLNKRGSNDFKYLVHGTYGIKIQDSKLYRSTFKINNRAGILTHPAWLISFSDNEKNQLVQRGRWVAMKLLGKVIPNAPIGVDASLPNNPDITLRNRLYIKTKTADCRACHNLMDEYGMPFEQFDFMGRFRTTEASKPVEVHNKFAKNPIEFVHYLASQRKSTQVFLRHVFRFFMGRNEVIRDANTLIKMEKAYTDNDGSLKSAITALLTSETFTRRQK